MKNKKKTTEQKLTLVDAYSEAFAAGVAFATANERAAALNTDDTAEQDAAVLEMEKADQALQSFFFPRSGFIGVPDPTI